MIPRFELPQFLSQGTLLDIPIFLNQASINQDYYGASYSQLYNSLLAFNGIQPNNFLFKVVCTGLRPSSRHSVIWGGVEITAACQPLGGIPGDPLVTDASGNMTFSFYFTNNPDDDYYFLTLQGHPFPTSVASVPYNEPLNGLQYISSALAVHAGYAPNNITPLIGNVQAGGGGYLLEVTAPDSYASFVVQFYDIVVPDYSDITAAALSIQWQVFPGQTLSSLGVHQANIVGPQIAYGTGGPLGPAPASNILQDQFGPVPTPVQNVPPRQLT
jgi:hypothetical protein